MTSEDLRAQLPALERVAYMNTGTAGPLPTPVVEAMHASLDEDLRFGRLSPRRFEKMKDDRDALRGRLGAFVGAAPDAVVLTTGTIAGIDLVFTARGLRSGTRTLVTSLEHPEALIPVLQRELDGGSRVEVVEIAEDATDADIVAAFVDRISSGDPVDAVLLSHVSYATGRVLPIREIVAAVSADVLTVIDGVQAVGAIPVDAAAIGADVYAFSVHKWLLGPEGVGALIVRDEALPALERIGGLGTAVVQRGSFFQREEGSRALEAVIPAKEAVRGALAALDWRAQLGEEHLSARMSGNTARIRDILSSHPSVQIVTPAPAAGLVSFRFVGLPAGRVSWELGQSRVAVRDIPGTDLVRVSSGFHLDDRDMEKLSQACDLVGNVPEPEACPMPSTIGAA